MEKVSAKEMIEAVAELSGQSKATVKDVVGSMFQFIAATNKSGVAVAIKEFGTFNPVKRANRHERTARNPRTGESVTVPAKVGKTVISFKPSSKAVLA